jgi:alanine dehydrogenase
LPYALALANKGWRQACHDDPHLRHGLNIHEGHVVYKAVAQALDLKYTPAEAFLA